MGGLTEDIGRFVADPGFSIVPVEALTITKSGFIDASGTLICGRMEPSVSMMHEYVAKTGQTSVAEASVLFGAGRASAESATLINALACHSLDYDDVGLRGHPSAVLVPAILAEAERRGLSGADAVRAYLAACRTGHGG